MVFKKHVDSRGTFQELFRRSLCEMDVKQISLCTINPGETRGGHYHKQTKEVFIVIKGKMELTKNKIEKIIVDEGRSVINNPNEHHSVYSKDGCVFLILLNKEYNPNNSDTYEY